MPKMKTRKAAAKRFSFTATGKVKASQANKKHRMRNRSKETLRRQRGTTVLDKAETKRVKKFLPNG